MDEKNYLKNQASAGKPIYIEAAINEEGPKKLRVEPHYTSNEYSVYENDVLLSRLKQISGNEWEQLEGTLSPGPAQVVGKAISRLLS